MLKLNTTILKLFAFITIAIIEPIDHMIHNKPNKHHEIEHYEKIFYKKRKPQYISQ